MRGFKKPTTTAKKIDTFDLYVPFLRSWPKYIYNEIHFNNQIILLVLLDFKDVTSSYELLC